MNPKELKHFLHSLNIQPLRRFSQNFLIDQNVLDKVIDLAEIKEGDRVLEIGPGAGVITRRLLEKGALVTAVEIDRTLAEQMRKLPITLIEGDILKVPLPDCDKVVSNLPYHLTTPILERILPRYDSCIIFCQEEMANRMAAQKGSREYGSLSLFVQFYAEVKYGFKVSRHSFYPVPSVDSAVVCLTKKKRPSVDPEKFHTFVQRTFTQRRKKLSTIWKNQYNYKIKEERRPEDFSLEDFVRAYEKISPTIQE